MRQALSQKISRNPLPYPSFSLIKGQKELHRAVDFTRNTPGGSWDDDGLFTQKAIDEPRFNFNPATGIYEGLYVEGQATRLNTQFSAPTTDEDVTVDNIEYTISFYGSGTITLSGAHSETINGTGSVTRTTASFTPSAGTLTIPPSGDVEFLQLEEGGAATSPIAGDGQQKTRDPDIATVTDLDEINFNPDEGVLYFEVVHKDAYKIRHVFSLNDGSGDERIELWGNRAGNRYDLLRSVNGTVTDIEITSSEFSDGGFLNMAVVYDNSEIKLYVNGAEEATISNGVPSGFTTLKLGTQWNNVQYLDSLMIKSLNYPRRLTNAQIEDELTS